jgi:hypothetical protein
MNAMTTSLYREFSIDAALEAEALAADLAAAEEAAWEAEREALCARIEAEHEARLAAGFHFCGFCECYYRPGTECGCEGW